MNCVILQPSYIPWRGYFHQIAKADVFIFYDDVQYDEHGWRNRNRVKAPNGSTWLTIPVHSKGCHKNNTPIKDISISWQTPWNEKHWATLQQFYGKMPYFDRYAPLVQEFYTRQTRLLADFTIETTITLARTLGIEKTRFLRSSDLGVDGYRTDRLIAILQHVGATHYISGPSARSYLEEEKFRDAGIGLEYIVYDYPEYNQPHPPFDPQVSIVDLLFSVGPDAPGYIWS